jgi:hypothetical protein
MAARSLVERGGELCSFAIDRADAANVWHKNLRWESILMTDEAALYVTISTRTSRWSTAAAGKPPASTVETDAEAEKVTENSE